LVGGQRLLVDATHVEPDAALKSTTATGADGEQRDRGFSNPTRTASAPQARSAHASEVVADAGYASHGAHDTRDALGATALIPPQPGARRAAAEAAPGCAHRAGATPPSIARRMPKARSPNSSATAPDAAAERGGCGASCWPRRLRSNLKRLLGHQSARHASVDIHNLWLCESTLGAPSPGQPGRRRGPRR
jgi:hypothetical protein